MLKVVGLKQALGNLGKYEKGINDDIKRLIARIAFNTQREARSKAPSDTGRLRGSINVLFSDGGFSGYVGVSVEYGKFVEFGTGPLGYQTYRGATPIPSDYIHSSTHSLPPANALAMWARHHNMNPHHLAAIIKKRGGNPARPYLGPAFRKHASSFIPKVKTIVQKKR